MNDGGYEPIIDQKGTSYKSIDETDPADGPFFCPSCWSELKTVQMSRSHITRTMEAKDE